MMLPAGCLSLLSCTCTVLFVVVKSKAIIHSHRRLPSPECRKFETLLLNSERMSSQNATIVYQPVYHATYYLKRQLQHQIDHSFARMSIDCAWPFLARIVTI